MGSPAYTVEISTYNWNVYLNFFCKKILKKISVKIFLYKHKSMQMFSETYQCIHKEYEATCVVDVRLNNRVIVQVRL